MLYTHYLISTDNRSPYRELGSNITDPALAEFILEHYSHFCENEECSKEQFSIYTTQKEMTVGCISQLYLREKNRYFYLSHIYCMDMLERERVLSLLPNIIATAEFEHVPKQEPDLSMTQIPCREEDDIIAITYPKEVLKQLVQASVQVLLNGGNLFIVSGWEDCFDIKARDLMSQIIFLLPYQCRRKLNFCSYANDIDISEDAGNIIFCRPQDALAFQKKYGEHSIFYFLQQQLSFPSITAQPFADFAVEHIDQITEMLIYADRKLTGKLKNDPEFYDVLCHFRYVEKDESLDNYAKHRAWLVPNLSQLYQLGIASRKKALQLLENELHFEPDDSDVPFETKLSAFLYCYETGVVSKELMHDFLLHIRSCTDHIKWQLLCKQLQIPIEEEELPQPEEEASGAPEAVAEPKQAEASEPELIPVDEEEEDEETVEILSQPTGYDVPDEEMMEEMDEEMDEAPEEEELSDEESEEEESEDADMPFLSVNIPPSAPKEEEISEEKPTMLPKETLEPFIHNLMQSSNIIKYINAGCLHYSKPLYEEFYVQRAVAQYLASAVACCGTAEELNKVREIADQVKEYQVEAMIIIAGEVQRLADEREAYLVRQEQLRQKRQRRQQEEALLAEFDAVFQSNDIHELKQLDVIPRCIAANLSKEVIEAHALKLYRKNKNAMSLLFLCCEYDIEGTLQECVPERIEQYLHANIRARELKYEWLNDVASLPDLKKTAVFYQAICAYAGQDEEIVENARLNRDALYYLLVENGILKSASRKYFIFGGIVIAAITVVAAAGIFLSSTGFFG